MAVETTDADLRDRRSTLTAGAAAGAGSWLLAYLVTYAATSGTIRNAGVYRAVELLGTAPPLWKVVAWVFYNAHFVPTNFPGMMGSDVAVDFVARYGALSPGLYLVPPLALAAAGATLARRAAATSVVAAARTGALAVVGYLPLAGVGAVAAKVPVGGGVAAPDFLAAVLLAGVAYPGVCGGLGGALATRLD